MKDNSIIPYNKGTALGKTGNCDEAIICFAKALHENKIILGRCCVSEDDPTWQCTDCYAEIWRQN